MTARAFRLIHQNLMMTVTALVAFKGWRGVGHLREEAQITPKACLGTAKMKISFNFQDF